MKADTLKQFKQRARQFCNLYEELVILWNGSLQNGNNATYPVTVLVEVIVYNIAYDASDCVGYSHEKAVEDVKKNLKALHKINEYEHRCYMTHYPYNELSLLFDGMNMSEDFE